jgi:hypothetical protein
MTMVWQQDGVALADRATLRLCRLVATHLLRVYTELRPDAGSGDTTFNYVQLVLFVLVAGVATAIWSAFDRGRRDCRPFLAGLTLWLRYFLFCTMMSYGFAKVLPVQFGTLRAGRLIQPYGHSSPMGLLWTFMAASPAYTVFGGAGELLGGLLIAFRRTALAGALVVAAVMTNVAMLNLCYDVCVKLFSLHVVAVALLLIYLDRQRLVALVGAPVPAATYAPLFTSRKAHRLAIVVQAAALVVAVGYHFHMAYKSWHAVPSSPLAGAYRVARVVKDRVAQPLVATEATTWRRAVIGAYGMSVYDEDDRADLWLSWSKDRASLIDEHTGTTLTVRRSDATHVVVAGKLVDGKTHAPSTLEIDLLRIDPASWLLTNRGFHFVNEVPYNR